MMAPSKAQQQRQHDPPGHPDRATGAARRLGAPTPQQHDRPGDPEHLQDHHTQQDVEEHLVGVGDRCGGELTADQQAQHPAGDHALAVG